jgi:uncharacterized protein with HEPN domain
MSERTDRDFLNDIREAIQRSTSYVAGMNYDEFLSDTKTQDAAIRNLEDLGEASKNLSERLRAAHSPFRVWLWPSAALRHVVNQLCVAALLL